LGTFLGDITDSFLPHNLHTFLKLFLDGNRTNLKERLDMVKDVTRGSFLSSWPFKKIHYSMLVMLKVPFQEKVNKNMEYKIQLPFPPHPPQILNVMRLSWAWSKAY